MSPSCPEIATRLRSARFENGAALLLGSRFPLPSGALRWAHLGIAQLLRERVVHRLWIRTQDPHWTRISAMHELLPESVDLATCHTDFAEITDSRAMAVISVQGCHPTRFAELIRQEEVSLWIAAGLGPEEAPLAEALAEVAPGSLLVVSANDMDAYFDALAQEFGGIHFAPPPQDTADRLRQASLAQMMRKMTRTEQLVEFERSMQATAVAQAARGQAEMRITQVCPPDEVSARAEQANHWMEIASRLLPSAEAYLHWGRSLRDAGKRLTGLRAARLFRSAAAKLRLAARYDVNNQSIFDEWIGCMRLLRRSTPRETFPAVTGEIDREFQWRIAHGAALSSEALVTWARTLTEWSVLAPGDESRKLFVLARTRMDEAKRRAGELEPLHAEWASLLCLRARHVAPAEAERVLGEALEQVAGTSTPEAALIRARCHFQLAGLPGANAQERIAQGDDAIRDALACGAPRHTATSEWARLYVELATARFRQQQSDAAGYFAYAQNLFSQANDYLGWSAALLAQSRAGALPMGAKKQILETAREHALEAESIAEGSAAFDLARLAAALREEDACRGWLSKASRLGTLPDLSQLLEESEFSAYRQKPWFRAFTGV